MRWTVSGALVGTMEVWLEPVLDGTMLHYFLRADPAGLAALLELSAAKRARAVRREIRRRQLAAKQMALRLKMALEDGRLPGIPPRGLGDR